MFPNSLLKEISFALQTDRLHPLESLVSDFVVAVTSKAEEEPVSAESDVVAHHCQIHPYQFHWEGIDDEFHLDFDCTAYDLNDA